jgi:hypothetical protein
MYRKPRVPELLSLGAIHTQRALIRSDSNRIPGGA